VTIFKLRVEPILGMTRYRRRNPEAVQRRKSRWLANGGLEKAENALARNTSKLFGFRSLLKFEITNCSSDSYYNRCRVSRTFQ
jgi:hypothetical protein